MSFREETMRVLQEIRADIRGLRSEVVNREVYAADQRTRDQQVRQLVEEMAEFRGERVNSRRVVLGAALASVGGFLAQLAAVVIRGH